MSVSYKKLWKLLIDKNMIKKQLREQAGLTTNVIAKLGKDGTQIFDSIDTLYFGINGSATLSVTEVKAVTNSLGTSLTDDAAALKNAAITGDIDTFNSLEQHFVNNAKATAALGEFGNIGGQAYLNAMINFLVGFNDGKYSTKYYVTANYEGLSVRDAVRFAANGKMDTYAAAGVTIDSLLAEIAK